MNKPYGCLSQFTGQKEDVLLGDFYNFPKDVYSVGRLDKDSEGLLLLTNDNALKAALLSPENNKEKTYWVEVEGDISASAIEQLKVGNIELKHKGETHFSKVAQCKPVQEINIWERNPPIRYRKNVPTSWIELTISEGKNRQVRKMTAAVGFPTLRLVRVGFGAYQLNKLQPGEVVEVEKMT